VLNSAAALQALNRAQLQLGAMLGMGAVGIVFAGAYGGQPAAIKVMGRVSRWEPAGSYRYEHRVYQQLEKLQGSCVPRVLGHGLIACYDQYFLALELLPGKSLARLPQPLEPAVQDGAVAALQQVHALGVMHGDVRLENFVAVPLGTQGEHRWRVVVLDFDRAYLGAGVEALREERAQLRRLLGLPCGMQRTGQP
jgi:predicted Ser/Thr protein kinase